MICQLRIGTDHCDSHLDVKTWWVSADHADTPKLLQKLQEIEDQFEALCDKWLREHDEEEVNWSDPCWIGTRNARVTEDELARPSWAVEPNRINV